jgi:hypothetical protein
MTVGKSYDHILYIGATTISTFKPVALPQLATPNTLKSALLEVGSALYWATVNRIDNKILG